MTHDSLEFFDMYRDRLRDLGVEPCGNRKYQTVLRYGKSSKKLLPGFNRAFGIFLLHCGRKLMSAGERLNEKGRNCGVHGLNKKISWRGAR